MKMNKKGQFFVIALVLISVPFFLIFTFSQTTSSTEVKSISDVSDLRMHNLLNIVEEQNDIVPNDWYDSNWKYRLVLTGSTVSTCPFSNSAFSGLAVLIDDSKVETGVCSQELVITTQSSPSTKLSDFMTTSGVACSSAGSIAIVCTTAQTTNDYYVYFGNPDASESTGSIGFAGSRSITDSFEQSLVLNCTQISADYPSASVKCGIGDLSGGAREYFINYTSTNLKYISTTPVVAEEPPMGG